VRGRLSLRRQRGPDGLPARRADRGPPRRAFSPVSIDVDEAARMLTVVMCGLISPQLATSQASPTAWAASTALPPQPSTCTSRTTELVFARPAAAGGDPRWARASKWSTRSPGTGPGMVTAYEPHRRYARHRAALRRARPELRPPPRHREPWPRSRRRQRPSTGTGSVDDHGVMLIFAGRRRGGAPLGSLRAAGPELPA
jgi:hypothetical protein